MRSPGANLYWMILELIRPHSLLNVNAECSKPISVLFTGLTSFL